MSPFVCPLNRGRIRPDTDHIQFHRPSLHGVRARHHRWTVLIGGLLAAAVTVPLPVAASDAVPSFNESYGCGALNGLRLPLAERPGYLSDVHRLYGPAADFFGRTIGDIRHSLVTWVVPGSGGKEVAYVHERALPAFQNVAANITAGLATGEDSYWVRTSDSYSFVARTIGGRQGMSFHAIGASVDINSASNPYRADNSLISNMPDWWVKAWVDAGFCWGGDWVEFKDPMHFSWMGPAFTPGYGPRPPAYPPRSAVANFSERLLDTSTVFGLPSPPYTYLIGDGDRDGAPDLVRVGPRGDADVVEFISSSQQFESCGRRHWPYQADAGARQLLGDIDGDSRPDVWSVDASGPTLQVTVTTREGDYGAAVVHATAAGSGGAEEFLAADVDRDGIDDLIVIRVAGATAEVWSGADGFQTLLRSAWLPFGSDSERRYAAGDRDEDGLVDLFALDSDGTLRVASLAEGWGRVSETIDTALDPRTLLAFATTDFDGDGRVDVIAYDKDGDYSVDLGGTGEWAGVTSWFVYEETDCALAADWPTVYRGVFWDDDESVHEAAVEWAAAAGVTSGCNPPFNDMFCPTRHVTRGELAAFLARAMGVSAGSGDFFTDDDGIIFEPWLDALASEGVLRGCNPPANDRVCPGRELSRAELAAVLVRALPLEAGAGADYFTDDDGSVFEVDIDRLAHAAITMGCNPPQDDLFCPDDSLTRAQLATFLWRAFS